jgi:basic amino acid/polyamine antiporter, APA family
MAIAMIIGTVIGSGVFKKASIVSENIPAFGLAISAWVLVGVLVLFGALALAEVATLIPKAGGNYAFLSESYGRWAGFLFGWVEFWIIRCGSIAALATIFTESIHDILRQSLDSKGDVLSHWARAAMTITVIAVIALVNIRGTRVGGGLQVVITSVKVASLVLIALLPFLVMAVVSEPRTLPTTAYITPPWPADWGAVSWSMFGGALIGIFWAYHGWMNIATIAEDVKNPNRNLPLALIVGVFTIIILYVSANIGYYLIIPQPELAKLSDRTVVGEYAFRLLGPIGLVLASTAVMISVFGALNGNLLSGPRLLFAMGRDGLAPNSWSRLHPRYHTPALAATVLTGWSILLVVGAALMTQYRIPVLNLGVTTLDLNLPKDKKAFDVLTDFAMFGALSFETLGVASIFVLRRRYPASKVALPYRCPFYPWVPLAYVVAIAVILANMFVTQQSESLIGVGFIVVGAVFYFAFLRKMPAR